MTPLAVNTLLVITFVSCAQPVNAGPGENGARHIGIKVLTPDLKPAIGAKVHVMPLRTCFFEGDQPRARDAWTLAEGTTGKSGEFEFKKPADPFIVVVFHDAGYTECMEDKMPQNEELKLSAWCRVFGRVATTGTRGPLNYSLSASGHSDYVSHAYKTKSNDGSFEFTRVVPGYASLIVRGDEIMAPMKEADPCNIRRIYMIPALAPGESRNLLLDDSGPAIKFRLDLPEAMLSEDPVSSPSHFMTIRRKWPETPKRLDDAAATKWRADLIKSDWGQEMARHPTEYHLAFQMSTGSSDRVFEFPSLSAGEYDVLVMSIGPHLDIDAKSATPLIVPSNVKDKSIDLGVIRVEEQRRIGDVPKMGEDAPEITGTTLDGKPFKLSDYRGKYVLLNYVPTWDQLDSRDVPNLKRLFEDFKANPRFAMIGLSPDQDESKLRKLVESEQLGWTHVRIEIPKDAELPRNLGVQRMVLIDPDGKVAMGHVNDCAHAKRYLERVLGSPGKGDH